MSVGLPTSSRFDAPSLQPLVRQGAPVAMHPFDAAAGITDAVRLDLNESILTLTPAMRQRMGEVAATASLVGYPDGACTALRDAAARFFSVRHRDCLAVGNGADDLIGRLCATFGQPRPGRKQGRVLVPEMSFEAYKMAATANGMAVDTFCFEPGFRPDMPMLESAVGRTRPNLVFLATPNNPTGQTIEPEAMKAVLKRHPDVLFVLDEAYIAYSDSESLADAVVDFPNAVCLSSLSKLGLAGLRLGFASAHPAIIRMLNAGRMPFPVNALSQAVGTMFLDEFAEALHAAVKQSAGERDRVYEALVALQAASGGSFNVVPSQGNFHLLECTEARALRAALLQQGVVVRTFNAPHLHHPLASVLRISVGTPEQNDRMLAVLKAALNKA